MLAFILPLKPRSQSKNWKKDCDLLRASIHSLLNQQSGDYSIYVVYSDDPGLQIDSEKVHFIQFPFDFVDYRDIPDVNEILVHFNNEKIMLERRWDKSRKIFYGCKIAIQQGCDYLMSVDADDLISNKLVKYVVNGIVKKNVPGFYIEQGFLYRPGSKRMIYIKKGMQNYNGSTHILRKDLVRIPDFENGKWMDYNLFTSHGWIRQRLKESHSVDLEPIPFPAVIYVAHGGNISNVSEMNIKEKIKNWLKIILRGKRIDNSLVNEFSIPVHE